MYEEETNDTMRSYNEQYDELFEYISEKTGLADMNMNLISDVHNALFREVGVALLRLTGRSCASIAFTANP